MSGLDKLIYTYSFDTSAFYNENEQKINKKLFNLRRCEKYLRGLKNKDNNQAITKRIRLIKKKTNILKTALRSSFSKNKNVRSLDKTHLRENNVVSIFDSVLSRTLDIKQNELTDEIVIIRAYYFEVLKDLIKDGFVHNGEKYIYFSSSAGQIRTKKGVWIKESSWETHKNSLTCGLNVKDINKQGGSNINKFLAYITLTNSASAEFKKFDINKTIVVDDLETNVTGLVDYIDRDSYEITRKEMDIPIEHTDGAGMILPRKSKKSFMVRLPFMKGLLVPFAFDKFAKENGNQKVKDIYGKEWDIIEDEIEIIFTKSQFKMWKYYKDWEEYKNNFTKYDCQAAKLNEEETTFNNAKLNYQMLQTLTDITDKELKHISYSTVEDILKIGSDKDTMLRVMGATSSKRNKNPFQSSLEIYPELLNDVHAKEVIKDIKKSLVKDAKAGKLNISGKYTFICPDMYAFCERLFLGIENPNGLLKNNEVYCSLYNEGKVDMLRSPHLYREHGVKNNIIDEEKKKWFITKGIYTSVHDTVSKMLQFDVDGDKSLVIDDKVFVEVAERNMKGIVPLYYEMANSPSEKISNDRIYDSLIMAFKANIGEVSNNITKIWNSDEPDLEVVKWLCMENNFIIDYAKTLFMPQRPSFANKRIKKCIKRKVPHFFIYAKDKEVNRVELLNSSVVNRLEDIIPDKRIFFRKIAGKFDYKYLLKNKSVKIDQDVIDKYEELNKDKRWLIQQYKDKSQQGLFYIDNYIRDALLKVNKNIEYVTDVLVVHLYSKNNGRTKMILWDSFGDVLLQRLQVNLRGTKQCEDCGVRIESKQAKKVCEKCGKKRDSVSKREYKARMRAKK